MDSWIKIMTSDGYIHESSGSPVMDIVMDLANDQRWIYPSINLMTNDELSMEICLSESLKEELRKQTKTWPVNLKDACKRDILKIHKIG